MLDEEKGSQPTSGNDSDRVSEPEPKRSFLSRFSDDLDPRFVWAPLLVCCFATGLTDGTLYNAYGTFVSMQTGNTVFVALAL
ncbi:hypothetical protein NPX13_g3429 [Xylaria arbuscula]|uniref:DUF1275 domain-containing protein n=1 Tax=Xylaria arbuscula TaxID=114810 RepID=A0A9W8NII5_9PEZI|nr:hypothetical protein NPX13_g3429 [Xylaria arbuscula]